MKLMFSTIAVLILSTMVADAQKNVGINNSNPAASAALMVDTATSGPQGLLIPRMTQARRNAIASPENGLMVYQTDNTPGFYYYTGSAWTTISGATGVPVGGTAGQVLAKVNSTDYNTQWITPASGGTSSGTLLIANKVGGTAETLPIGNSTTPTTIKFNNIVSSTGSDITYDNSTGVYTVQTTGVYFIQVKLLCNDASVPSQTVPPYLTLIKNNATYATTGSDLYYGDYPPIHNILPTGIRGQGSLLKIVQFTAGDTFKIVAVSGNSTTAAQPTSLVAGSNITIYKM